ncbi:MAG: NAD(P)-dependent alcohol dehydrogenase [Polyangiaceae bacterium]
MKVTELAGAFGLENLVVKERASRALGPNEVRVAIRARSLNFRDLLMVTGKYNPKLKLPVIPLSDGAGEVVEVGPAVRRFAVGDRVCPTFFANFVGGEAPKSVLQATIGGPLDGTLTEEMVLDEESAVTFPSHLSFEQASTLPCAALTAWSALVTFGRVEPGQTVLVQGTGGVSLFALQFAKLLGARVIVTSSSDEKLARAKALGADECVNYKAEPEWGKVARAMTDGVGVDHVVEVGGGGTLGQSIRAVRPFGTISLIGILAGSSTDVSLLPVLMQNVRVQGVLVGSRNGFEAMNRAIATSKLEPVVDRTFAFDDARAAFEALRGAGHFGKLVVV